MASHLGDDAPSTVNEGRTGLETLEKRFKSLEEQRRKLPSGPQSAGALAGVLRAVPDVAPMRVIPFATLKAAAAAGSVEQLSYAMSTVDVREIDSICADAKIFLISHRWWSSTKAQPDRAEDGWPKVRFVCDVLAPRFCGDVGCEEAQVFVWWDFLSIDQVDRTTQMRQIECLPIFVAMADAVCALRAGDENFHAPGGPRCPKSLEAFEGAADEHPGHYDNRVWTAIELYCATSPFVREFAGCERRVYDVRLGADFQPLSELKERYRELRYRLHETYDWTLPPRTNLDRQEDLLVLEPLAVIMRSRAMPRIVTSAICDLKVALRLYIDAGYDVNATASGSGACALHCAARRSDTEMIGMLLAVPGVKVDAGDRFGNTALHEIIMAPHSHFGGYSGVSTESSDGGQTFNSFTDDVVFGRVKACVRLLLEAGADPTAKNAVGRSPLAVHADWATEEDIEMFVGHEDKMRAVLEEARMPGKIELLHPPEKLEAALAAAGIVRESRERVFANGNVVGWEELTPATASGPLPTICYQNGASMSFIAAGDLALRLCQGSGWRVCVFDNPGAGRSVIREGGIKHISDDEAKQRFLREDKTSEELLDYLLKDLEVVYGELAGECAAAGVPLHAAGTSLGALFVTHFGVKHPEWFASLTLFGMIHGKRMEPHMIEMFTGMLTMLTTLPVDECKKFFVAEDGMRSMVHPSCTEQQLGVASEAFFDGDMDSRMPFVSLLMMLKLTNVLEYEKVRCPVRFVTGEADVVYIEHAELVMSKLAPSSKHATKCVTMPRVGHTVSCENPELAASIMLDFVRHLEVD